MKNYSLLLILIGNGLFNATTEATSSGWVVAWGNNSSGQTTVPVAAWSGVTAIAAGGEHTVALKTNGSIVAWGNNSSGQTTIPVAAQSGVIAIAAGNGHTVALKTNGSVVAWGENFYGQTTVPVEAQSGVTAIAAAGSSTLALKSDGTVITWGGNGGAQTPSGLTGVIAIAASRNNALALKSDGSIAWFTLGICCGIPIEVCAQPVPMSARSGVTAIAAGGCYSVVLKNDGSVIAWGDNSFGQTNVPVTAQNGVTAIAAADSHTVALKNNGSVVAWGWNLYGQTTVPAAAQSVRAIAAGGSHSVALVIVPPTIVFQPTNQVVFTGSNITFSVVATTTNPPIRFQWRRNGTDITGATNNSLTIGNVQLADAGNYNVMVSDIVDSLLSSSASLGLLDAAPPTVTTFAATGVANYSATLRGTVNPNGGLTLAYFEYGETMSYGRATPTVSAGVTSNVMSLSNLTTGLIRNTPLHFRLVAYNLGGTNYGADHTFVTTDVFDLAAAVDNTRLTWTSGGDAVWNPQTIVTYDGIDAAQSGAVFDNQQSWMEATVVGPATLTFWWKVSSAASYDFLRFSIDSVNQPGGISGEVNWQQQTFAIGAGTHSLRWTYLKDAFSFSGQDHGWVDQVVFTSVSITAQATNQVVFAGSNATFVVSATTLNPPLRYQWQFDGADIAGATNSSLTITNAQVPNAGDYNVVLTDGLGSLSSALASLSLIDAPAPIVTTLAAGNVFITSATLRGTVNPNGAATTAYFQWGFSAAYGALTPIVNIPPGGNTISLSNGITGLMGGTTYHYRIVASSSGGTNYGADLSVTTPAVPPVIAVDTFDYPAGPVNGLSGGVGFSTPYSGVGNISAGGLSYTDTNGFVMAVSGNRYTTVLNSPVFRTLQTNGLPFGILDANGRFGADGAVIYIAFLARLETGTSASYGGLSLYDEVGEKLFIGDGAYSTNVNWGLNDHVGGLGFGSDSTVPVTNTTRLLVTRIDFAAGAETIRLYVDPPLRGEPTIPSAGPVTKADFRFTRIRFTAGSAGTHGFGELRIGTSYADVLNISPAIITQQPTNQFVSVGANATFSVSATTTNPPLRYQWRFNGTNIAGATNQSIAISNVQPNNVGNYNVVVSDAVSVVSSASAALGLLTPYIATQPTNLAVRVSSNATFTVTAVGPPPLFYQWRFNGANLANGTNATLLITNVQDEQFGSYVAVIANNYGSVTSSIALLQIIQSPVITQQPQPVTAVAGEAATFTVTVTNNATLPITFRWIRQGIAFATNVLSSTTCSLTLVDVRTNTTGFTNGAGLYRVNVVNAAGSVNSSPGSGVALTVIAATAPSVLTLGAASVGATDATLTGSVNPNGAATSAHFEYGLSTSYGSSTPDVNVGNDTNSVPVSIAVSALAPTTTYHFRLVASNGGGMNFGVDQTFTPTAAQPPIITGQPQSQFVETGDNVTFAVTNTGSAPLGYSWLRNGVTIVPFAAGTSSLTISNVQLNHAGSYTVLITNPVAPAGVLSDEAFLTIHATVPLVINSPAPLAGRYVPTALLSWAPLVLPVTGNVVFEGEGCAGTPYPVDPNGKVVLIDLAEFVTGDCFVSSAVDRAAKAGAIAVLVAMPDFFPPYDEAFSDNTFGMVVPTLLIASTIADLIKGSSNTVNVTLTPPFGVPGFRSLPATELTLTSETLHGEVYPNGIETTVFFEYGADWTYGNITPLINVGSNAVTTAVSGLASGLTENTFHFYRLVAITGGTTNFGRDEYFMTASLPMIVQDPSDAFAMAGEPVVLSVDVIGSTPLSYRWSHGGTVIVPFGAASNTLHLPPVSLADAGNYHVDVTNPFSAGTLVTSGEAHLTVIPAAPPTAITLPASTVKKIEATLEGTVNPNGGLTTVHFEYGTSASYGRTADPLAVGNDTSVLPVSAVLPPLALEPNTTYHFRLVATSVGGTAVGGDVTFTTLPMTNFIVMNTLDTGPGSLRNTIAAAELADTIQFHPTLNGQTINLASQLFIDHGVRIFGPGADQLAISGSNFVRVFYVSADGVASISGLTIRNGKASAGSSGGGIYNQGILTIEDCALSNNVATAHSQSAGGALININGAVIVRRCVFARNRAFGNGGALYNYAFAKPVWIFDSVFIDNTNASSATFSSGGGALYTATSMTISNCWFHGNRLNPTQSSFGGSVGGGALYTTSGGFSDADILVVNSRFTSNACEAAAGGAILNFGARSRLTIHGSTFTANKARGGGAVETENFRSVLVIGNSTFSGNTANYGGAVSISGGEAILNHCTIVSNIATSAQGGGIRAYIADSFVLANSLIAGNSASANSDVGMLGDTGDPVPLTSIGHNLIGVTNDSSGWIATDLAGSMASPLDPRLGPLADNGGLTRTFALLPGSPAVDAGDCLDTSNVALTDQRGVPRPQGAACDIGAFELQVTSLLVIISAPRRIGNIFSVSLNTQAGRMYFLEFTPALSNPTWSPVANAPGTGFMQALTDLGATNSQRFYRVRVE